MWRADIYSIYVIYCLCISVLLLLHLSILWVHGKYVFICLCSCVGVLAVSCRIFCCSSRTLQLQYAGLVDLWHVGSQSPTRDQTHSPALQSRFLTTGPPGRSLLLHLFHSSLQSHIFKPSLLLMLWQVCCSLCPAPFDLLWTPLSRDVILKQDFAQSSYRECIMVLNKARSSILFPLCSENFCYKD